MRAAVAGLLLVGLWSGCAGLFGSKGNDTYQARKRLAHELIGRGDWTTAFYYADDLHRERPRDAEVLAMRGIIFRERGLPTEAEADLKAAVDEDDRLSDAHAALGILYDTQRRGEEAERHHRRAVALQPQSPVYLNNLGFSLFLRRRFPDSIEAYQRAARLSPTSRRIRTNLGFAYAASGDLPRAAHEFEMGGSAPEAKNNLGYAYEQRGNLAQAFELYIEALRIDPRYGRARANLLYVAKKLGKEVPEEVSRGPIDESGGSTQ
jgi:Flp pilus assembly protein TadD